MMTVVTNHGDRDRCLPGPLRLALSSRVDRADSAVVFQQVAGVASLSLSDSNCTSGSAAPAGAARLMASAQTEA